MKKNPLSVYQDLQTIRLTASVLYDRGRALDRSHEQLAEDIAPLKQRRSALVKHAVAHDLGGVICAIRQLQADSRAHLEAAQFLKEKAEDASQHARELLEAIKIDMQEKNMTEAMQGDFSATLVNGEINVR